MWNVYSRQSQAFSMLSNYTENELLHILLKLIGWRLAGEFSKQNCIQTRDFTQMKTKQKQKYAKVKAMNIIFSIVEKTL